MGMRFGIRVPTLEAARVHENMRPETPFVAAGVRRTLAMGPFPYGTQRAATNKVIKAIGRQAKPTQPITAQPGVTGMTWAIQSVDAPPVETAVGELLIREVSSSPPLSSQRPVMMQQASVRRPNQDPLMYNDPWQKALGGRGACQQKHGQCNGMPACGIPTGLWPQPPWWVMCV